MRAIARTTIVLALLFAAAGSAGAAQVTIGIRIGRPPAPRVVRVDAAETGPGVHLGRGLLVSGGTSLPVARRLLDAPAVPRRTLGGASP